MSASLENVIATTDPFPLDVGKHVIVVAGDFAGATATLQRRPQDVHGELWVPVLPPFAKVATAEFVVVPNATGLYRLAVDPGAAKQPKLSLIIGSPPVE